MADLAPHDSRDVHLIDPTDPTKKGTYTVDGSKHRLDVATENAAITTGARFHVIDVSEPVSIPFTGATHTVNTGKVFHIKGWRVNSQGATYVAELQEDGSQLDHQRQDNSAFTSVGTGTIMYDSDPIPVAAGVVIRVQLLEGSTGKEYVTFFWGVEVDA